MANLTFLQAEQYCRAYADKNSNAEVAQGELIIWATLAQRKVQQDLMTLGIKNFTKRTVLFGQVVALPSDISSQPNALISVKCSGANGAPPTYNRATFTSTETDINGRFIIYCKEPGTIGYNSIVFIKEATATFPHGTIKYGGSATALFDFDVFVTAATTAAQVVTLLNASSLFGEYAIASLAGTGAVAVDLDVSYTLLTGVGTGWYPAKEIPIEDYNFYTQALTANVYKAPTVTDPAYCIEGDASGTRLLKILPNKPVSDALTVTMITYRYILSDVTSSGSLSVPIEYEELVLTDMLTKFFDKLLNAERKAEFEKKYSDKINQIQKSYQDSLMASVQEKTRINSMDKDK